MDNSKRGGIDGTFQGRGNNFKILDGFRGSNVNLFAKGESLSRYTIGCKPVIALSNIL